MLRQLKYSASGREKNSRSDLAKEDNHGNPLNNKTTFCLAHGYEKRVRLQIEVMGHGLPRMPVEEEPESSLPMAYDFKESILLDLLNAGNQADGAY